MRSKRLLSSPARALGRRRIYLRHPERSVPRATGGKDAAIAAPARFSANACQRGKGYGNLHPNRGTKAVKLSRIAKSPLTYIAVAIAITAFAAGLFVAARMSDIAASESGQTASAPREVVVLRTVTYRNPDGSWPSPVPTAAPPTGQDYYDPILHPDATGIATMGKLLYLYDGGSIQLPPDVYVRTHILIGTCLDWTNCPEFPAAVLARGDYWALIDRYGKPVLGWSSSPDYRPDAFGFLNE